MSTTATKTHKILSLTLEPKKGQPVNTRWLVELEQPYPDYESSGTRLSWRNHGGLLSSYNSPAVTPETYRANLILPTGDLPQDYNRTHFAGYEGNPGTFSLRGSDLGEIRAEIRPAPRHLGGEAWVSFQVRGFNSPTPGEHAWLEANVVPALRAFIAEHRDELRQDAAERLSAHLAGMMDRLKEEAEKLAAKIPEMLATFSRTPSA
jgi:hypothetical protein